MTREQAAIEIASAYLAAFASGELAVRLVEEAPEEVDFGWAFRYTASRLIKSGAAIPLFHGQALLLVDRRDGGVTAFGEVPEVHACLEAYRACGDPQEPPLPEVALLGWLPYAVKVEATKAIMVNTGLGLSESKHVVDDVLERRARIVKTADVEGAHALAARLNELRFVARVRYGR